ncbi:MAG: OmpA family protein [Bacteroidaceae bacterium]|nr:OmpA family protein [Bacteroidaceae bacterium]
MKNFLAFAFMTLLTANAAAQSETQKSYKPAPYVFIGLQGGGQTTFTDFDAIDLITPTASFSIGVMATPVVGLRLHANGIWNRGGIKPNFKYDYRYVTGDLDIMLNLCTLFGKYNTYALNLYLIGGGGANYAWQNNDIWASTLTPDGAWQDNHWSHNIRVGTMLDWNLGKHVSLNLEVAANFLDDRYNSKVDKRDDIQLTAQLGLMFKFGYRKVSAAADDFVIVPAAPVAEEPEPKPESVPAAAIRPTQSVQAASTAAIANPEMRQEIFFDLNSTQPKSSETAKIELLAAFMQQVPDVKVSLTGYADAGTGTPQINIRVANMRVERVAELLREAGIDAGRISVETKGAAEQPFAENDKNRVVIAIAKK